jgi:hypothetical protein
MPDREKLNIRYDKNRRKAAQDKAARMRLSGYDIDVTAVITAAMDTFVDESDTATARRLGLVKAGHPVGIYRRPTARTSDDA